MWVIGLVALVVVLLWCTVSVARRFPDATRESRDLARKPSVPHHRRVSDWPEIRLDAVVIDPEASGRVLVFVHWPAHTHRRAVLTIDVGASAVGAHRLLHQWRDTGACVSPTAGSGQALVLRRRRSSETVCARVVSEAQATVPR